MLNHLTTLQGRAFDFISIWNVNRERENLEPILRREKKMNATPACTLCRIHKTPGAIRDLPRPIALRFVPGRLGAVHDAIDWSVVISKRSIGRVKLMQHPVEKQTAPLTRDSVNEQSSVHPLRSSLKSQVVRLSPSRALIGRPRGWPVKSISAREVNRRYTAPNIDLENVFAWRAKRPFDYLLGGYQQPPAERFFAPYARNRARRGTNAGSSVRRRQETPLPLPRRRWRRHETCAARGCKRMRNVPRVHEASGGQM